jgi:5,5'-dehydrodivanillate O-demethylase
MSMATAESEQTYTAEEAWHTGPGTLAGRYLRGFWQPVRVSDDLPPGRAKPVMLMGQEFTLYRGESGTPYAVGFRCAHRGTQLSTGWVEGDCIRCFYHGWMYDGAGQCVQQPAEEHPFADRIRVPSYPTQDYLGLIFVYLGEGEPPPLPRYPDFEGPARVRMYVRNCNVVQNLENDAAHVHFVHRTRWGPGPAGWSKRENLSTQLEPEETEWGFISGSKRPDGTITVHAYGMPNVVFQSARERDIGPAADFSLGWKVPLDDEHHLRFFVVPRREGAGRGGRGSEDGGLFQSDPWEKVSARQNELTDMVLAGELTVDEAEAIALSPGEYGLAILQDSISQMGQGKMWTRENEHLGSTDLDVIMRRRLWARDMQALAEGRPITPWQRPERLQMQNWPAVVTEFKAKYG